MLVSTEKGDMGCRGPIQGSDAAATDVTAPNQ